MSSAAAGPSFPRFKGLRVGPHKCSSREQKQGIRVALTWALRSTLGAAPPLTRTRSQSATKQ